MEKIILASSSPRRKELLQKFDLEPIIVKPSIEEKISPDEKLEQIAMALAFQKANQVGSKYSQGEIIIGADTIVAYKDKILGKPKNKLDAKQMLEFLSGKEHEVITGISILKANTNIKIIDYEKTVVKFRKMNQEKIENYIKTEEYIDKAGSYGIQGLGGVLVEGINGCYFNVVGLPLYKLDSLLGKYFDINLL